MSDKELSLRSWLGFAEPFDWKRSKLLGALLGFLLVFVVAILFTFALLAAFKVLGTSLFSDLPNGTGASFGLTGIIVAVIGSPFVVWRTMVAQKQASIAEQGLFTDRLNKAVEALGAERIVTNAVEGDDGKTPTTIAQPKVEVRVGAILALDRIAIDSPDDSLRILELLNAYLTENCKGGETSKNGIERDFLPSDLKAAFRISFKLAQEFDKSTTFSQRLQLDYRRLDLSKFHVLDTDFQFARFNHVNMSDALFHGCKFKNCHLRAITAKNTVFQQTRFYKCLFRRNYKLASVRFVDCGFLMSAFHQVDLTSAKIELKKLKSTFGDASVKLPNDINPSHPDWPENWSKEELSEKEFMLQWRAFRHSKAYPNNRI